MTDLVAIILAAGKGTRMYSGLPKVLHNVAGQPMLDHVVEAVEPLEPKRIFVVTGFMGDRIAEHVGSRAQCVHQARQLGTAHAVRQTVPYLEKFTGDILVTVGDAPLIRTDTLRELLKRRRAHQVAATVLTAELAEPSGYGRVVRNRDGTVRKIVEEKDTNVYEAAIHEVNTGIYVFDGPRLLEALRRVGNRNVQKEYYLTDVIEILNRMGCEVEPLVADDPTEMVGVNSRADLAGAEALLRRRIAYSVMEQGVTVIDPATTYIDKQVQIGRDTVIQPFTILQGRCRIGAQCRVGPNVFVSDSAIGDGCTLKFCSVEQAEVGDGVSVGPYSSVRPGSVIRDRARIGTFVEVTRSDVGEDADILHLSYIADAEVGKATSIGTGSVTVNFDGARKQPTFIGDNVFLGSNTSLVAPVRIADNVISKHNTVLTGRIRPGSGEAEQNGARLAARAKAKPKAKPKPKAKAKPPKAGRAKRQKGSK